MNAASRVGRNDPLAGLREELRALTTILSNAGSTRAEIERLARSVLASQAKRLLVSPLPDALTIVPA